MAKTQSITCPSISLQWIVFFDILRDQTMVVDTKEKGFLQSLDPMLENIHQSFVSWDEMQKVRASSFTINYGIN